jgi:hypothetical protein
MKDTIIHTRVSENLKDDLLNFSYITDKSVSKIVRIAIEEYLVKTNNCKSEQGTIKEKSESLDLIQTLGFTELIFWIYDKKWDPEINESNEFYIQIMEIIEQLNHHPLFTNEIIHEFNKVSIELKEYLYDYEIEANWNFKFPTNCVNGFNYEKLSEFMYGLRYDVNNEKTLIIK